MSTVFFTIVARNYVSYARVLCRSIRDSHPEAKIYVAISDSKKNIPAIDVQNCELITLEQLNLPNLSAFQLRYDVMELSTAIKPYVFNWLFSNTSAQKIIYLDPDILVISPLSDVLRALDQGASLVLTPHLLSPISDGYLPNEITMLRVGVYNLGFIGVLRCPESMKAMAWWADRLERGAIVDLESGLFTDQKWADLFPTLFEGVMILRSPGYNVAYWNLRQREIKNENGKWLANNEVISFIHFSGVDPLNPGLFSKHQNRISLSEIGPLRELYDSYLRSLLNSGYKELITIPYELGMVEGVSVGRAIRTYFRLFLDDAKSGDFPGSHHKGLRLSYFNELEKRIPVNTVVSRYMYGIYLSRKDLQMAFDLNSPNGIAGFSKWCINYLKSVHTESPQFLKSLLERLHISEENSSRLSYHKISRHLKKYLIIFFGFLYNLYPQFFYKLAKKYLPKQIRQTLAEEMVSFGIAHTGQGLIFGILHKNLMLRFMKIFSQTKIQALRGDGVSLYGYLKGDFGVAENLRSVAGSLKKEKYFFDIVELDPGPAYNLSSTRYDAMSVERSDCEIELFCINADQMAHIFTRMGIEKDSKKYRIGYWFWELSKFPAEWVGALEYIDELWAPTKYIQQALSDVTKKPVIHMPVAVEFNEEAHYQRKDYDLPDHAFLYLFSYDLHSFSSRKNPQAALNAFLEEFDTSGENVGLVIKTIYGEQHPIEYQNLLKLAKNDSRIYVINKTLSRAQMYGLIGVCDCYISLHRAEGFGLGMAEAMYLGKPVIATGYSGNLDFMNEENSCLVDYELIAVKDDEYPHASGQVWANPNIRAARSFMRRIFEDVNYRKQIAKAGQATILRCHSFERVGAMMVKRILEIRSIRGGDDV